MSSVQVEIIPGATIKFGSSGVFEYKQGECVVKIEVVTGEEEVIFVSILKRLSD